MDAIWLFGLLIAVGFWFVQHRITGQILDTENRRRAIDAERDSTLDTLHPVASRAEIRRTYHALIEAQQKSKTLEQEFLSAERRLWKRAVPASEEASRLMFEVANWIERRRNREGELEVMLALNARVFRGELSRSKALAEIQSPIESVLGDMMRRDDLVRDWRKRLGISGDNFPSLFVDPASLKSRTRDASGIARVPIEGLQTETFG